jgi:uncharacterized protein YrzB (UPF0473 family)
MPGDNGEGTIETLDESENIETDDLRTLVDEDGNEVEFLLLAIIQHEGNDYALLSPMSEIEKDTPDMEVFVMEYEIRDGQEHFEGVEDEDTFNAVSAFASTLFETTVAEA